MLTDYILFNVSIANGYRIYSNLRPLFLKSVLHENSNFQNRNFSREFNAITNFSAAFP